MNKKSHFVPRPESSKEPGLQDGEDLQVGNKSREQALLAAVIEVGLDQGVHLLIIVVLIFFLQEGINCFQRHGLEGLAEHWLVDLTLQGHAVSFDDALLGAPEV